MVALGEIVTTPRPADPGPPENDTALRRWLFSACVIFVYCLLGIVAFWPIYPGISQRLFSPEGDFTQSVWYLDWIPHAIAHGLNPFFSKAIFVPTGVNLAQNTASPLLGLFTAPFAPVLSPVVRANLLMLLGMPVSATAAFVVLRKWKVWGPAAAARWVDLWLLAIHDQPRPWPRGTDLRTAPTVHRVDPRLHPATHRVVFKTRDPARPAHRGPVLHLTGSARNSRDLHPAAVTCVAISRRDDLAELGRIALSRWDSPLR